MLCANEASLQRVDDGSVLRDAEVCDALVCQEPLPLGEDPIARVDEDAMTGIK